jgi:hypothetical protein
VRRTLLALSVISVALSVAGCGSGKSATSTTATAHTSSSASHTRTAGGRKPPPPNSAAARRGASNVRLPAVYTILPGDRVSPPTISAPTGVRINLRVFSGDLKVHHVVLHSPGDPTLSVPAHGSAAVNVSPLTAGHYALYVDGTDRALLIVGVAPGP